METPPTEKELFSFIYERRIWGDVSPSGQSALPSVNAEYLRVVESEASSPHVHSVLDFGCGDYSLFHGFSWPPGVEYLGVDIVPELIGDNLQLYTKPNVSFKSASEKDLPPADLILCKDVFQYWDSEKVVRFVKETLPKYGKAVLAYDMPNAEYLSWRSRQKQYDNFYSFYDPKVIMGLCGLNPENVVEYTYPKYEVSGRGNMDIVEFTLDKQVLVISNGYR